MDENGLSLPPDTLKILNEFLEEKNRQKQDELENIQNKAGKDAKFEEDWQLSQFWYSDETKKTLGEIVKKLIDKQQVSNMHIALLSCPSLYTTIKQLYDNVQIFEYDKRFAAYGDDFVFYDFNEADTMEYLKEESNKFDFIIADPPFLSEECITKICKIIQNLCKSNSKIIFCSGEIIEPWLEKSLHLKKTNFKPQHERNLGNEFVSYANFDLNSFINA